MADVYENDDTVEVSYRWGNSTVTERQREPTAGFPQTIERDGHHFDLVARDIVSRSGELTHRRVTYREARV